MNIIDLVLIGIILLYVLNGVYRGFLPSIANLAGFFISWISSLIFFRPLSARLMKSDIFSSLRFYIEGSESVGDIELAKRTLSSFSWMLLVKRSIFTGKSFRLKSVVRY